MTRNRPDYVLLALVGVLVTVGFEAVFSSSFVFALDAYGDVTYFVVRQALWAAIGGLAMLVTMRLDYHIWARVGGWLMLATVVMLVLVLLPWFGVSVNGAQRWLRFGPLLPIQPSEFAKLAMVLYCSAWLAGRGERLRKWSAGFIPFVLIVGSVAGLVLVQPDLGTTIVIVAIGVSLFFAAGASLVHLALLGMSGAVASLPLVFHMTYRQARWEAFIDPWRDPRGIGFHIIQSLIAIGTGGVLGRGLGSSLQKFYYVPGSHTDAIFAIIGEETGLVGGLFVMALFAFLAYRGFRIAFTASDKFGALLALGITTWIVVQAMINIGGVTKAIPWTGITLPFISYGGSSLAVKLAAVGILLNVSRHCLPRPQGANGALVPYLAEEGP